MVYPTPGFVVRQTFLEFEPDAFEPDALQAAEPNGCCEDDDSDGNRAPARARRERCYSDTEIYCKTRPVSIFGSEELRLYCEARREAEAADAGAAAEAPEVARPAHQQVDGDRSQDNSVTSHAVTPCDMEHRETPVANDGPAGATPLEAASTTGSASTPRPAEPGSREASDSEKKVDGADGCTTVVLEELSSTCTGQLLRAVLDSRGFVGLYDFLFLPMDLRTRTCNGYALINFVDHDSASRAVDCFNGAVDWIVQSPSSCSATFSPHYQGLDSLIERYRNSPVMHEAVPDAYKPQLFDSKGLPVDFPAPTKALRMPRLRTKRAKMRRPNGAAADEVAGASSDLSGAPVPFQDAVALPDLDATAAAGSKSATEAWFVDLVASRAPNKCPQWLGVS
eukprot:TRINITY_DN37288_c0_g1_i1.p1 TRINITY_DN37288_c0_g1~~TRINITY_DN37288_c0_g1_i1.p1  ORF type:complete len:395 (+),score=85.26 TRINITY_DN37288_c0_g1_i1:103-1287(+)